MNGSKNQPLSIQLSGVVSVGEDVVSVGEEVGAKEQSPPSVCQHCSSPVTQEGQS